MTDEQHKPQPPVVIVEHGDVMLFETVMSACLALEPIDVRNEEYLAYDSAGYVLRLVATEPTVSIAGRLSDSPMPEQLAQVLRSYAERATKQAVPPHIQSLGETLAFCLQQFGYTQ